MQRVGEGNGAGAHGGDSVRAQQHIARGDRATWIARRGVGVVVLLALAIPATPGFASAAAGDEATSSKASPQQRSAASKRVAARKRAAAHKRVVRRARERARLSKALRRNPRSALRRGDFLRRAAISGLKLPVTVRLREGTTLGVNWIPTRSPLDGALFPEPSGEQPLDLLGSFPMVIDFDAGPGYGGPGNIQGRSGPGGGITAAGPLVLAELAGCAATPPPFIEAATTTTGGAPVAASAISQTWVDMNPFNGASSGYLDLKLSVRSRVLQSTSTCGSPGASADYDVPVTTPATDPWNAAVRIRWDGSFRIAPAITADGAIRFGKITVDGTTQPQGATSGNLWGCAPDLAVTGAGLPLATPCTPASAPPLGETVSPAPFPASLIMKSFSADILLGDRN